MRLGGAKMEPILIADLSEQIRRGDKPRADLAKRVANVLREQIVSGKLKPGTQLISEVALAQSLEISRPTLREAIRILGREGFLHIKHGVGTFVADEQRLIWARLDAMRSFTDLIRSVGGVPGDSNLSVSLVPAPLDVAEALDLAPRTPVGLVDRVRLIDGTPLAIANEFIALPKGEEDFARLRNFTGGSLYDFLRQRCGVSLSYSSLVIAAVAADTPRARRLKVHKGTPLLLLREPHFDLAGRPVMFTVNYHNSELVQFTLTRAGLRI
jgi:GntR family transcriptional regulator